MNNHRSTRIAGLGIVLAGLVVAAAPAASAAKGTGVFSYTVSGSPKAAVTIQSPTQGRCYATKGIASAGVNKTDMAAKVFKDSDCKQIVATIAPGKSDPTVTFASVRFS